MSGRALAAAIAALMAGLFALLTLTGPIPETEVSGNIRRSGGVCLELSRWSWLGWRVVGQTTTVNDTQNGVWREPTSDPACAEVPRREYLVRVFSQPYGTYRLCGLADDNGCVVFRRVPFTRAGPGP